MYVYGVLVLDGLIFGIAGELSRVVEVSRCNRLAYRLGIVRVGARFNLHTIINMYIKSILFHTHPST